MFNRQRRMDALELPELREQTADTLTAVKVAAVVVALVAVAALIVYATRES